MSTAPAEAAPPSGTVDDNTVDDLVAPGELTTVANLTFPTAGNVSQVDVNLAGPDSDNITTSDVDSVRVFLLDSSGNQLASQSTAYTAQPTSVTFGGNVSGVSQILVRAQTSSASDGGVIDAEIGAQDSAGGVAVLGFDTNGTQTIDEDIRARLRGEVQFQNGTPADNVTIEVYDVDTGATVFDDVVTRGFDDFQAGTWGNLPASPGNYSVRLDEDSPLVNQVEVFSTRVTLERGETRSIDTTLDPLRQVGDVDCTPVQVFADETGTFTITVEDESGTRLEGAEVQAVRQVGSPDVQLTNNVTKFTSDGNTAELQRGQVQFDVVTIPNTTASATFTFEISSGGDTGTVQCSAIFVQNGEGYLSGDVRNAETTGPIEGARVWTVLGSSYQQNERYVSLDIDAIPGIDADETDDNVVWFRLVDRETGDVLGPDDIIDNDDYDVRNENYDATLNNSQVTGADTGVRLVEQMNVSDSADGQGFAVVDLDGDSLVAFNITRIAPEDYFLQFTLDAPNASRAQGVAQEKQQLPEDEDEIPQPWSGEQWYNVTDTDTTIPGVSGADNSGEINESSPAGTPADDGFDSTDLNAVYFQPPADLTYQQTVQIAQLADSNLVDAPGFVNSFGVNTAGTDENGDFVLNKLYTEFQVGRAYVAIAEDAGFSTDFHDVIVEEDGEITFRDAENREAFQLQPEPIQIDLNVTNLAALPSQSVAPENASEPSAYSEYYFDTINESGDQISQELSRDGETVDVILVEANANRTGEPVNDTVTLSVPDRDPEEASATANDTTFDGDFLTAAGGDIIDEDEVNNTVTLSLGEDGEAIVWLQTDFTTEDLAESTIFNAFGPTTSEIPNDVEECTVFRDPETGDITEITFSGIVAQSNTDRDATDSTCKDFTGVTDFRNASVSGFLSDRVDERVSPTFVYVQNMRWDGTFAPDDLLTIEPDSPIDADREAARDPSATIDVIETTFTVTYYEDDGINSGPADTNGVADPIPAEQVTVQTGVTATDLLNFKFSQFPAIEDPFRPGSSEGFKLAEFSQVGDSEYTLKPLPAERVPGATGATTQYQVRGLALDRDKPGTTLPETGNASAETQPGFTDDANIAFGFLANADFVVSDLDAPSQATNGSAFTVNATVTNEGTTGDTKDVEFKVDLDQDGNFSDEDAALSKSVQLGVGETEQVTFEIPEGFTSNLNGTYAHGVFTPDSNVTAEITITTDTGSDTCEGLSSDVEAYAGSDCSVSSDELSTAISDWAGGDISTDVLSDVIAAWAQSG